MVVESKMKRAYVGSVIAALVGFPGVLGGCTASPLVVVENDGGAKGNTTDSGSKGSDQDSGSNGNESDAGVCVPNGITFKLSLPTKGDVYLDGPTTSLGCSSWLTIEAPAGSQWGIPQPVPVNVAKNGCGIPCPAAQRVPAADQSFTWDGTYYPVTTGPGPSETCDTPACMPPGTYIGTMCVAFADGDAGAREGTPTCQEFHFTWPPASPSEATVQLTITPPVDGG
jgi:hypothetical protein